MLDAVLFDLDGTLLDTAPDLISALDELARELGMALPSGDLRPCVSFGTPALLGALGFGRDHPEFPTLRQRYLAIYEANLCRYTQFFEGVNALLDELAERAMPWGIVTNKPGSLTERLLAALELHPACCVSGDTLRYSKPHPAPLLRAANLLGANPLRCIYVGDIHNDILAAQAAGMRPLVAAYGYGDGSDCTTWGAPLVYSADALRGHLC